MKSFDEFLDKRFPEASVTSSLAPRNLHTLKLSCYDEKCCGELLLFHGEQRGPEDLSLALQAIAIKIAHFPFGEWHKHAL